MAVPRKLHIHHKGASSSGEENGGRSCALEGGEPLKLKKDKKKADGGKGAKKK